MIVILTKDLNYLIFNYMVKLDYMTIKENTEFRMMNCFLHVDHMYVGTSVCVCV